MTVESTAINRWLLCASFGSSGVLGKPILVSLHSLRWAEFVSVSFHELVPHDDDSS